MAITRDKKKVILEKLKGITGKESVVFVQFHGLPVADTAEMRSGLRNDDISYFVARKTLIRKAFEESGIEGELPQLDGELALAYADELTAPARGVYEFQKKFKGAVSILGGVFENKYLDKVGMEEIAQIPSQDVLRGMFVNVINSPIQGFVMALSAIAEKKEVA